MYEDFAEFGRQHVSSSLVTTISDIGHQILSLKPPAHPVVNTLGFTPVGLQTNNASNSRLLSEMDDDGD